MAVELTEALLRDAAGWEAMKRARSYLEQEQVLSSNWTAPLLKGVVQSGERSLHAGLVIKGPIDLENICPCRESRESGKICAHSVAVGLHWLNSQRTGDPQPSSQTSRTSGLGSPGARASDGLANPANPRAGTSAFRIQRETTGEPAGLCVILSICMVLLPNSSLFPSLLEEQAHAAGLGSWLAA